MSRVDLRVHPLTGSQNSEADRRVRLSFLADDKKGAVRVARRLFRFLMGQVVYSTVTEASSRMTGYW